MGSDIIFTSGGTESNHTIIHSRLESAQREHAGRPHVITSTIERDSIQKPLRALWMEQKIRKKKNFEAK